MWLGTTQEKRSQISSEEIQFDQELFDVRSWMGDHLKAGRAESLHPHARSVILGHHSMLISASGTLPFDPSGLSCDMPYPIFEHGLAWSLASYVLFSAGRRP